MPLLCFGQLGSVRLKVQEKHNRLNKSAWEYAWIYNADTSYKKYSDIHRQKAIFDSLPADEYTVTMYSIYGNKKHRTDLIVSNSTTLTVQIDTRKTPFIRYKDSIPLSAMIEGNDTFSIQYSITQCINAMGQTSYGWADIYKMDNKYYMNYKMEDSTKNIMLSLHQIDKLIKAEKNLLSENISFFNSNYEYTVRLNNLVYENRHAPYNFIKYILKP